LALFAAGRIVVTEVMANPAGAPGAHMPEDRNESQIEHCLSPVPATADPARLSELNLRPR